MGFNSFFFVNTGPKAEKKEKKTHTHNQITFLAAAAVWGTRSINRCYLLVSQPGTLLPCLPLPSCNRQPRLSYFIGSRDAVIVSLSCPSAEDATDKKKNKHNANKTNPREK